MRRAELGEIEMLEGAGACEHGAHVAVIEPRHVPQAERAEGGTQRGQHLHVGRVRMRVRVKVGVKVA